MTAAAARLVEAGRSFRGTTALTDVSIDVPRETITGLLGRNGAGKTTIMRLLTGHIRPDSGRVEVDGEDPFENERVLARTCFVREGQRYPDYTTVARVLRSASWVLPGWDDAYAHQLAADFRLPLGRRVAALSRGMLSAVGVVVGLASRAPVTFFDEPYLGLDATARQLFYDHLVADYAEHPRTVVLSTHLIDEVADLLEHVVVVDSGRVVLDAPVDALRGRRVVLTGPEQSVTSFLAGRATLSEDRLAGTVRAALGWDLTPGDRDVANQLGLSVEPMTLQQLVVHAGGTSPHAWPTGTTLDEGALR